MEVREYLSVLQRRKWLILAFAVLGLGLALLYSFLQTPIYQSRTEVQVQPITADPFARTTGRNQQLNPPTETALATSIQVAGRAAKTMKTDATPQSLLRHVAVDVPPDSFIVIVTYSDSDAEQAQRGARAFAQAYLGVRRDDAESTRDRLIAQIEEQLAPLYKRRGTLQQSLEVTDPATAQYDNIVIQLRSLDAQIAPLESDRAAVSTVDVNPGRVLTEATLPNTPASPKIPLNAALGLFLGLFLGIAVAFLRDRTDERIRGRVDLEENLGYPVLSIVPRVRGWKKPEMTRLVTLSEPNSSASEAYRTLRTGLLSIAARRELKTILVVSPLAGEGKSTTAANLAVVLAQAGKRVDLVSADLRKPRIHQFFGLSNDRGVSNVLVGEMQAWEVFQRAPGVEGLVVFASGPVPRQPAELLESNALKQLVMERRDQSDFVVLDSSPALLVADYMALVRLVDGVLVVVDAANTRRGAVIQVREQLDQAGARVLGAVLNNLDSSKADSYQYGYGYQNGHRYGGAYSRTGRSGISEWERLKR